MAFPSSSGRHLRLEDEFYRIMPLVRDRDWRKFARQCLRLHDYQIDDVIADHQNDNREQKYQMLSLWQRRNGRIATSERLHLLIRDFNEAQPPPQNRDAASYPDGDAACEHADRYVPSHTTRVPAVFPQSAVVHSNVGSGYHQAPSASVPPRQSNFDQNYSFNPTVDHDENENIRSTSMRENRAEADNLNYAKASGETVPKEVEENKVQHGTATTYPHKAFHASSADDQNTNLNIAATFPGQPTETCDQLNDHCSKVVAIDIRTSTRGSYESHLEEVEHIYRISHKPKGAVLVINNSFNGEKDERSGCDCDIHNMNSLWKQIGCMTIIKKDLSAVKSIELLEKFSSSPTAYNSDFVVVVIMSHGGQENGEVVFYGEDRQSVEVRSVLEIFNNANARRLQGVPKLFFFQICRGTGVDKGVAPGTPQNKSEIQDSFSSLQDTIRNSIISSNDDSADALGARSDRLPTISDCLISYATQEGFKAFRNNIKGSWFVNAVVNTFLRHAHDQHVADLMTMVNKEMSKKSARSKTKENLDGAKVMSDFTSTLRKKLYMFPGFPNDDDDCDEF